MSRTLQNSELHDPPVEKEVTAILSTCTNADILKPEYCIIYHSIMLLFYSTVEITKTMYNLEVLV